MLTAAGVWVELYGGNVFGVGGGGGGGGGGRSAELNIVVVRIHCGYACAVMAGLCSMERSYSAGLCTQLCRKIP